MPGKVLRKESIPLETLLEHLEQRMKVHLNRMNAVSLAGKKVVEKNLHRPGLVLTGYTDLFQYQRLQILGNTEIGYLEHLHPIAREHAFDMLVGFDVPCIILTAGNQLEEDLLQRATAREIPVLSTPLSTTKFMTLLGDFLELEFAPRQTLHASLVDVYGVGLLLTGKAGIGKSEIALDLVERGHRLVADDVVVVTRQQGNILIGSGTDVVKHFMEIRGVGLVDTRAMFGIRAIRFQKRIELVVQMELMNPEAEYTRITMIDDTKDILGVDLPVVRLPITPGKNVTVICEVIAMNYLLSQYGYDAAESFAERLRTKLEQNKQSSGEIRHTQYFDHDYE